VAVRLCLGALPSVKRPSMSGLGLSPEDYASLRSMGPRQKLPRLKKGKARFRVGDSVVAARSLHYLGLPVSDSSPGTIVVAQGNRYFVRWKTGEGWVSDEILEEP
jgi:hypothetical protein